MTKRPAWTIKNNKVYSESFEFEWNGGFAIVQKRKNIESLHRSITKKYNENILEVSSKSTNELGVKISAFNLKLEGNVLENIFQSSKVYENGGPFPDLLYVTPKEAKKDEGHWKSGKLVGFQYKNRLWEIEPKSLFYDFIFLRAILQSGIVYNEILGFDWFTDIEFNPNKSFNCQARSVAVFKLILDNQLLDVLNDYNMWLAFHRKHVLS